MSSPVVGLAPVEALIQGIHVIAAKDPTNTICKQIRTLLNKYYVAVSESQQPSRRASLTLTKRSSSNSITSNSINIPSLNVFSKLLIEITEEQSDDEKKSNQNQVNIINNNKLQAIKEKMIDIFWTETESEEKRNLNLYTNDRFEGYYLAQYTNPNDVFNKNNFSNDNKRLVLNDFLSIHLNLIQTKLKKLLKNISNNDNDIEYLFNQQFDYFKKPCAALPIKHNWELNQCNKYFSMIEKFRSNNNKLVIDYCIIYNAISNMYLRMYKNDNNNEKENKNKNNDNKNDNVNSRKNIGFDAFLNLHGGYTGYTMNKTVDTYTNDYDEHGYEILPSLCMDYTLTEIAESGIFGHDIHGCKLTFKAFQNDPNDERMLLIKKLLFKNDLREFERLIKYCLSDLKYNNNWCQLRSMYGIKSGYNSGIVFYIINRLSYAIFHDIMVMRRIINDRLLFPTLDKLFKYFYNFSIYCHLYPNTYLDSSKCVCQHKQALYISEYDLYKDKIYKNIFGDNITIQSIATLDKFTYLSDTNGTLLQACVGNNFVYYSQILIHDGHFENVHKSRRQMLEIATKNQYKSMVLLLADVKDEKEEKKKDDREKKDKNVIASGEKNSNNNKNRAIGLKYDTFMNQLMFAKYFLLQLGCDYDYDNNNNNCKPQHKSLEREELDGIHCKGHYMDDLFVNFGDFNGINGSSTTLKSDKQWKECMNSMVLNVIDLLNKKLIISDDVMILCFEYCKQQQQAQQQGDNGKLYNLFVDTLNRVVTECATVASTSAATQNTHNGDKLYWKERNSQWFEYYLVHSNIWMCKDNKRNKNGLLFDNLVTNYNSQMQHQKQVTIFWGFCGVFILFFIFFFYFLLLAVFEYCLWSQNYNQSSPMCEMISNCQF